VVNHILILSIKRMNVENNIKKRVLMRLIILRKMLTRALLKRLSRNFILKVVESAHSNIKKQLFLLKIYQLFLLLNLGLIK